MQKLVIFSAPSGAGKTTLVKHVIASEPRLQFSTSATTRAPRKGERDGTEYYFKSKTEFEAEIRAGSFLEWEEVYEDVYYGTLEEEVHRIFELGKAVIFDVDVVGGLNLKKGYGENALAIFVAPPSLEELKKRLKNRSTESAKSLKFRLEKAEEEMGFHRLFDFVLVNDDLEKAKDIALKISSLFLEEGWEGIASFINSKNNEE